MLHLKSAVTALPDGTFLRWPELVDNQPLPDGPPGCEEGGCHVVPLGGDRVLIAASAPRMTATRWTTWASPRCSSTDNPQDRTAPSEYVTIAYRAATGARLWARHYQNGSADQAGAAAVAVSPAGLVFVTGTSQQDNFFGDRDYATIAYSG